MKKEVNTPLGVIYYGFIHNGGENLVETKKYENGSSEIYFIEGYKIEIISFKIDVSLYNNTKSANSCGWIFRIEKISDSNEKIETYCWIDKANNEVIFDTATGEHLDAIEANNKEWVLHIGTEDGEVLRYRAEKNDWFPSRLKNKVDFCKSITETKQNGFVTKIPSLNKGEKICIQYLVAYDKKNGQEINTWLAVDHFKRQLENWIGVW